MGLFNRKKKNVWINPSEYTVNQQSTVKLTSYILDECVYNQNSLAALCALVCPSVPPVRGNLKVIIKSVVSKCDMTLRHANKFYAMALSTSDPKEFFDDIAVVRRDLAEIKEVGKYAYYGGLLNEMESYRVEERYQIELRHMIDRAAAVVVASGSPADTAALHLAVFKAHESELDAQSQKKLSSKYKKYIK